MDGSLRCDLNFRAPMGLILVLAANLSFSVCVSAQVARDITQESTQAATVFDRSGYAVSDQDTVVIQFDEGKSKVSVASYKALSLLMDSVKANARIDKVIVAAWSDRAYPIEAAPDLSNDDQALAKNRLMSTRKVLLDLGITNVTLISMAKHPSLLSRMFDTDEAKLKGQSRSKRNADHDELLLGRLIREKGSSGRAVVLVCRASDLAMC